MENNQGQPELSSPPTTLPATPQPDSGGASANTNATNNANAQPPKPEQGQSQIDKIQQILDEISRTSKSEAVQTQVAEIFKRLDKVDGVLEALKSVLDTIKNPGTQSSQPAVPTSPEVNVNAPKYTEVRKRGGRTVRRVEKEKVPSQSGEKKEPWYLRRLF